MLLPAILYKEAIIRGMQKYFYTTDMMYETGCLCNWTPDIADCPDEGNYQYAIVDTNGKLIGFLSYKIDWYSSNAYNFGLFSFDRGNPLVGKDVFDKLEELVSKLHRVEWRAVGGNPACRGYDSFIRRHNGNKHILKDAIKDKDGNYRDDIIYEIVKSSHLDKNSYDKESNMITKERAIEIALLYIPTMLGDEADIGVTDEDLEEAPKILRNMLPADYKQTLKEE